MRAYDFDDSIAFLQAKIKASDKNGRGQARKLAEHLGVHTTLISQILRKTKLMSLETAQGLCEYFGLDESETEYFLALVQIDRSGTAKLKKIYQKQAETIREKARRLENRLPRDKVLNESEKAIFYSEWLYSGMRMLTSLPDYQRPDAIAGALGLPLSLVNRVLAFLVDHGLCIEDKNGRFQLGPKRTMLEASSPLVSRHHANWRLRVTEEYPRLTAEDFAFTAPLTISEKGFKQARAELANTVEKISALVGENEAPEHLVCFNLDWVKLTRKRP